MPSMGGCSVPCIPHQSSWEGSWGAWGRGLAALCNPMPHPCGVRLSSGHGGFVPIGALMPSLSCSNHRVFGGLQSAGHHTHTHPLQGWASRALAPRGFPATNPPNIPAFILSHLTVLAGDGAWWENWVLGKAHTWVEGTS